MDGLRGGGVGVNKKPLKPPPPAQTEHSRIALAHYLSWQSIKFIMIFQPLIDKNTEDLVKKIQQT